MDNVVVKIARTSFHPLSDPTDILVAYEIFHAPTNTGIYREVLVPIKSVVDMGWKELRNEVCAWKHGCETCSTPGIIGETFQPHEMENEPAPAVVIATEEPAVIVTEEPAVTEEPVVTVTEEPAATVTEEPAVTVTEEPAVVTEEPDVV